jgi:Glycosyl hydrolase family 63 C-terminal domain
MAFYCLTMLSMALELAQENSAYEDLASKFFEHFVRIADAINNLGGTGLWDTADGFYYDQLKLPGQVIPLRSRSLVGLLPIIAVEILEESQIQRLPGFFKRMQWFIENWPDLARVITWCETCQPDHHLRMLAIPSRKRLERVLRYMLDESEFLSPFGIRSVSAVHQAKPYVFRLDDHEYRVDYSPGESNTYLFGGNSNWRGPIWFPVNYLLIDALECYHHFYGEQLKVECPVDSGRFLTLGDVAIELSRRLTNLFLPNSDGHRPCHGGDPRYAQDPHWRDLVLFHEYFHADTGRGCGASHQTGWTSLVLRCLEHVSPKPASSA